MTAHVGNPRQTVSGFGNTIQKENEDEGIQLQGLCGAAVVLNADTVAKTLGVSPASGYELLHEKGFPSLRIGNRIVVPKEQFIRWVDEHTGGVI